MLANILHYFYSYQLFKSVFFRAGMGYLTAYFFVSLFMPFMINVLRKKEFISELPSENQHQKNTPIMGGAILIPAIIFATLLWIWLNPFIVCLLIILITFGTIGLIDDLNKVRHRKQILNSDTQLNKYAEKADGISGKLRLTLEIIITLIVIGSFYVFYNGLDGHLHIPMIPMMSWFPALPQYIFFPFVVLIIVGGANAVNLTDGLDSLATIPILTCALFVAAASYVSGDFEISSRLKMLFISEDLKEMVIFSLSIMGACLAFLKYNCPPASIYMGDVGSLGLGASICAMFVFVKAELYLPIVGGGFLIAAISSIIQRLFFKWAVYVKGREWAKKNRFFYRAPYHHHQQALLKINKLEINSIFHNVIQKIGIHRIANDDQYLLQKDINNKVIWRNHITAIWLLVIALVIFFKIR